MNGDEFRKIRKAIPLTQEQMAQRLDVSRKTIVNWENNVFAIPDDALVTLTEKGVSPAPRPNVPVTPNSHPELYDPTPRGAAKGFQRNHKHPHWWTKSLYNYMTQAQRDVAERIVTMPRDLENWVWTSERAVVFTMTFVNKSREEAEQIVRVAGFDVPRNEKETAMLQYNTDWAQYQKDFSGAGWRGFLEEYPQHKEAREASPQLTQKQIEDSERTQRELDNAFKF